MSTLVEQSIEQSPQHEVAHEEFIGLLTGIANHEAKLAVTAIVASHPDEWFTGSSLWNDIRIRQGENPVWLPDRRGPLKYCQNSLGPVGLVVKGVVAGERGDTTAFTANDDKPETVQRGLALSGALMEWSLNFPDISLQKVLGVTASKGEFRTPEARYVVLQAVADNVGNPLTYMEIARLSQNGAIDEKNIFSSIRQLADSKILDTKLIDVAEDTILEIVKPYFYRGAGLHFEQMTEDAQLAYKAIDVLWEHGQQTITFKEFAAAALAISPEADLSKLRQYWYYGSNTSFTNMPGLKPVERKMGTNSRVLLKPNHADAVVDLTRRLREIDTPLTNLDLYKQWAREIIGNPTKMSALFAKARKFSANVTGQEESSQVVESQIMNVIKNAGSLTVKAIFETMQETNRPLTQASIGNYLGKLAKNGALTVEKRQPDASKKRLYKYYSLAE